MKRLESNVFVRVFCAFVALVQFQFCVSQVELFRRPSNRVTRLLQNFETDIWSLASRNPLRQLIPVLNTQGALHHFTNTYGRAADRFTEARSLNATFENKGRLDKVHFFLYTDKNNISSFTRLSPENDLSIRTSMFKNTRPIKFLVHGFLADGFTDFPQKPKNAYLRYTDYNVIIVSHGELVYTPLRPQGPLYFLAALRNVPYVAHRIAEMIIALNKNSVVKSMDDIHLIGFSLGSHICGQVGHEISVRTGAKVGRITALEPAGPLFGSASLSLRLDSSDAKFVDAIHSSSLALYEPVGHADFYPNGGRNQYECYDYFNLILNPLQGAIDQIYQCSHIYAYLVFTRSIAGTTMDACGCLSWSDYRRSCKDICLKKSIMGDNCPSTTRGSFFLDTSIPENYKYDSLVT